MKKVISVEQYINTNHQFSEGLTLLRNLISTTELIETIKWNAPVYTLNGKNVVGISGFKNHFGVWFFQGVFLKDAEDKLINAQEKTKGLRQMRFESIQEINEKIVLDYVNEAIENQKLGKEIKPTQTKTIFIPKALKDMLCKDDNLQNSFNNLSFYK